MPTESPSGRLAVPGKSLAWSLKRAAWTAAGSCASPLKGRRRLLEECQTPRRMPLKINGTLRMIWHPSGETDTTPTPCPKRPKVRSLALRTIGPIGQGVWSDTKPSTAKGEHYGYVKRDIHRSPNPGGFGE